ncbi:MAG: hypothetical protein LUD81_07595, partial [Clostridiales bacterium]|nr:hypothetical protein [Clostridiales bacterium]
MVKEGAACFRSFLPPKFLRFSLLKYVTVQLCPARAERQKLAKRLLRIRRRLDGSIFASIWRSARALLMDFCMKTL